MTRVRRCLIALFLLLLVPDLARQPAALPLVASFGAAFEPPGSASADAVLRHSAPCQPEVAVISPPAYGLPHLADGQRILPIPGGMSRLAWAAFA